MPETGDTQLQVQKPAALALRAMFNQGSALHRQGKLTDAERIYREVLRHQPNHFGALNLFGVIARQTQRTELAIELIKKAIGVNPTVAAAHGNLGNALMDLKRPAEALASYDRAVALKPDFAEAHNNRGNALKDLKRPTEALASYDKAIALKPDFVAAHSNRGHALRALKRFAEALESYDKAIMLKPDFEFLYGNLIFMKMTICDWSNWESQIVQLVHKIDQLEGVSEPFPLLAATNSPQLQRKAAEIYARATYPLNIALPKIAKHRRTDKIRIGYVSYDFRPHPVSYLIAGLIETHDRDRFEVVGVSLQPEHPSEIGQRIKRAFNKFVDVSRIGDQAVVQLMRKLEVDIAIDLMGYTSGNRKNIFALGAAPVQVNYMGFPGTMGAEYINYIIADKIIIPVEDAQFFSEKIVQMPVRYRSKPCNSAQRTPTRAEVGLPDSAFVFCCFNNNYKITPKVFDCWMRILKQVDGSVLWLFEDNTKAASNLRKEAGIRGINPERVLFAKLMPLPDHLARHRLADLFLDTLPYNAHTTASDALWTGLPVLTRIGETFAGRVAASLLNAMGLTELITSTPQAYEALAIELATNPEKLAAIKRKLATNRLTTPLFDIQMYTRHIEAAYTMMYERYQADLPPDHIYVPK